MREIGRGKSEGNLLKKKLKVIVGILLVAILATSCRKDNFYSKRSNNFEWIEGKLVKDLDRRNNEELVSYFAVNIQKQYGKKEIQSELFNAEKELGKIRKYRVKERGYSGHRGGLGETVTTWEIKMDTDRGIFFVYVNWSDGDDRKGMDDKRYRDTQGIKNLTIYSEDFRTSEKLEELYKVDFPVLYPGIQR